MIVRADDCSEVPGEIITADQPTGECCVMVGGESKTLGVARVTDTSADLFEGPESETSGRYEDDDRRLPDRLRSTVTELAENALIHGHRLHWI